MNSHQYINQDSGQVEYYTPPLITACADKLMGRIDLDPASSAAANRFVKANLYYTKEEDGLALPWFGCVWLNHPFSKKLNKTWIERLISMYDSGAIVQACCITFASTSEGWFAPLLRFPQFYFTGRVQYLGADGLPVKRWNENKGRMELSGSTKGSVVTFLPPRSIPVLTSAMKMQTVYGEHFAGETKIAISALTGALSRSLAVVSAPAQTKSPLHHRS